MLDVLEGLEKGKCVSEYLCRNEFKTSQNEILMMLKKIGEWDVARAEIGECVREGERRMEKASSMGQYDCWNGTFYLAALRS